jgi:hypothetical protein
LDYPLARIWPTINAVFTGDLHAVVTATVEVPEDTQRQLPVRLPTSLPTLRDTDSIIGLKIQRKSGDKISYTVGLDKDIVDGHVTMTLTFSRAAETLDEMADLSVRAAQRLVSRVLGEKTDA